MDDVAPLSKTATALAVEGSRERSMRTGISGAVARALMAMNTAIPVTPPAPRQRFDYRDEAEALHVLCWC